MTVTEKSSRKLISGSGWTNPLTHDFELENATHLKVYAQIPNQDDTLLVLGVNYTVSGVGVDTGYSVTINTPDAWATVSTWVLSVEPPISQADDVSLGGAFGVRFEDGIDALTRRVQRLRDDTRRSYKVPRTTPLGEAPMIDILAEGHFPVADADGNLVDGGDGSDILNAEVYAAEAAASATSAAALLAAMQALVPSVGDFIVAHYNALATTTIPSGIANIVLGGRTAFGDSAGFIPCRKVGSAPVTHNGWGQSADGAYWEFNTGSFANVKAWGALGNSTNNDYAAIQGAIDYLDAKFGSGQLYFPGSVGAYYCPSRLVIDTCKIDMFGANQAVTLHAGPSDAGLLYVNTSRCHIHDLSFSGMGVTGLPVADTDSGLTATVPCVELGSGAVDVHLSRCFIKGGTGLRMGGGDNKVTHCTVTRSYGTEMVHVSSGHYFLRNAMDQEWPVALPNYQELPNTMEAWTAGQVVAVGAVRETAGFYIQCRVAGTCGGTAPALKNYTVDIPDNTAIWRLVCRNEYAAYELGPTAQEVSISLQDISGCCTVGVHVDSTNTTLRLKLRDAIIGQTIRQALLIEGGKDIKIWKNHTGVGFQKDYPAIEISGNAVGHVSIDDNYLDGGATSILIAPTVATAVTVSVHNNLLKPQLGLGTAAVGIRVSAGTRYFYLVGNHITSSCLQGIIVDAGASNDYRIELNNNVGGLSYANFITDGGTGVRKTVQYPGRRPYYNPYDYGATGDGATDDTAALVRCQTAANANEGIRPAGAPSGRGVIILPPGNFKTTGITTQFSGEEWIGMGGTLTAMAANQTVFNCAHGNCLIERLIISQPFLPTANVATFKHSGGADCTFRKNLIGGGYYGIEASGGGDSVWTDNKVVGCYADFVYLHAYNGFWSVRNKFDGGWPNGGAPTGAQIMGAWATATAYAVGDVVTANGYYFQCQAAGTSAAAGAGPTGTLKGTLIVDGVGALRWSTHRALLSAGVHIESDSFINVFWCTDITGGHINSVRLTHTLGANPPQSVKFLGGCEFGVPLSFGLLADDVDDLEVDGCIVDNVVNATVGTGIIINDGRSVKITDNMIRQMRCGVSIGATVVEAAVDGNTFSGIQAWCAEFQANCVGFSAVNNKCGETIWTANANGIRVLAGTSDEYVFAMNRGRNIAGTRWLDGGTGLNKYVAGNV